MSHPSDAASPADPLDPTAQRRPIVELLILAAPTVAQIASYTLMQFTDRWMLGRIGGTEGTLQAAAAGTAGITFFAVIGFGFGVLLVVNTLVSQSFGRNDLTAAGRYLWQGIWFAVVFGLATMLLYPRAEELFRWMGHAPQMAKYEADYLRVVALVGSLKLITTAMIIQWHLLKREDKPVGLRGWLRGLNRYVGPRGYLASVLPAYLRYYQRDFHPWQEDDRALIAQAERELSAMLGERWAA